MRKRYAKLLGLACLIGAMGLLPSSQSRAAGWLKDGNYWYYMTDDGQKHTGWVHIGEKYYYMDESTGKMVTGWRQDSSTSAWYYFNQSGEMMTKWQKINNYWYYFNQYGVMQKAGSSLIRSGIIWAMMDGCLPTGRRWITAPGTISARTGRCGLAGRR